MIAAVVESTIFRFWGANISSEIHCSFWSSWVSWYCLHFRVFTGRAWSTWWEGWEREVRRRESLRDCVVLSQISKESAEYMVEEYKRLRQRDSTGGSVAMATHCPMESAILTSFTYIYILSFPPFVLHSTLLSSLPFSFLLLLFPLLYTPSSSPSQGSQSHHGGLLCASWRAWYVCQRPWHACTAQRRSGDHMAVMWLVCSQIVPPHTQRQPSVSICHMLVVWQW